MVYSPLDILDIAAGNPGKQVVFFAVGFETTAPAVAMTIKEARKRNLENFSVLVSHVLVPPAIEALLSSEDNRIDGFLAAGHVCTVMGTHEYIPIAEKYRVSIVVTGFEPVDILLGIYRTLQMLEEHRYGVENAYARSVRTEGNSAAQKILGEVFEPTDRKWRGMGTIPMTGFLMEVLWKVVQSIGNAALASGVKIVTGDTKVVEKGKGDRIYITTTGIGQVQPGVNISPDRCSEGDVVIINGTIGDHGI